MLAMLPEDWQTALAIVAHPDDLEYGTASAVARWTAQGKHVYYLLVTSGEAGIDAIPPEQAGPLREEEERRGARLVGVDTVDFLGYPDGVVEYSLALRRDISRYIRRYRPDILLTTNHHLTWPGHLLNMADHRWVGQAVLDAARDAGNRWIFPELLDEQLEPWPGVRMVCLNDALHATHAVDVTDYVDHGIASLQAHQTYLSHLAQDFDPETFLRQNARETGEQCGCEYAVAFEVIGI
ncbi:MAG: GlcNAc-PI de-N-acetylase [Candidatus Entotheonella factor]|uniref:GlcNAc-PI de-N-acetylase n=1 Tax=Entotheonella factor TaxID=1429438 RepID=W4LWF8_ENTF1|nr:PIG-L deacetylase family protein [Candidatus Entotheonella palauensis]ETX02235.1 MAG: GlcNAc-PI de-N-acetylase [Candidatus Entotheonella factor]